MSGERILVVDDEPDILSLLVYQFSREGFRVATAVNGRTAISTARDELPDAVVLDLMLPDVDGYQVLKTLREDEDTREIPVLLLTARKEEEERIRGFEHGADDYVTKPFSARELVLRVQALLRRATSQPVARHRTLSEGPVAVDRDGHRVTVNGRDVLIYSLEDYPVDIGDPVRFTIRSDDVRIYPPA